MGEAYVRLTVYFDGQFWIGVFERLESGGLSAAKVTFGAEPKEIEISEFIRKHYYGLRFGPAVAAVAKPESTNPKRRQREIARAMSDTGIGTKAQQALKLQQQEGKQARKVLSKQRKLEAAERAYELKQQKRKEKHRGR